MAHLVGILWDLVFILLHFFVFYFNLLLWQRRLFQPAVLFSFVWFVIQVLHFVSRFSILDQLKPLSINVQIVFIVGSISFSLGGLAIFFLSQTSKASPQKTVTYYQISQFVKFGLFVIILLGLPLYIQASYKIFLASQAEEFFKGLRQELTTGAADIGPIKYLMPVAYLAFAINLYEYIQHKSKSNLLLLLFTFLLLCVYALFATGRTYFLLIMSIYLGLNIILNKKFSLKKLAAIFSLFLLAFVLIGVMYGKGGSAYFSFKENVKAATENLGIYTVTPMSALDEELHDNAVVKTEGDNTLRFFIKIGIATGLLQERKVLELIQEYRYVPYPTNVYTYYSPYVKDYNVFYACCILFLFAALHTWIYIKAEASKNIRYIFYYSFLLFPILLSFFSDEYLTLTSFWLQIVFFTEAILTLNSIILNRKKNENAA